MRANWRRPEDLDYYEKLGYDTFKFVERNPTSILLDGSRRTRSDATTAISSISCTGNAYPKDKLGAIGKDSSSLRRMIKYFVKPFTVNMSHLQAGDFGRAASMLYRARVRILWWSTTGARRNPRRAFSRRLPVDRLRELSLLSRVGPRERSRLSRGYQAKLEPLDDDLLGDIDGGAFWKPT